MLRHIIASAVLASTMFAVDIQADERENLKRRENEILKAMPNGFRVKRNVAGNVTEFEFLSSRSVVSDNGLKLLAQMPYLEKLDITGSHNTDEGVQHLAKLRTPKYLKLFQTAATNKSMLHLGRLVSLETLDLRFARAPTPLTNEGLSHLKNLTNLKTLILAETSITDEGLVHLKKMIRLNSLLLSGSAITGTGYKHLQQLPLTMLDVTAANLNDDGLAEIGKLSDVFYLNLSQNKGLTQRGLEHLSKLPRLRVLHLMQSNVDDKAISGLQNMTELAHLNLQQTNVTDAGLEHLTQLGKLAYLNLGSTKVSDAGVKKLQLAHGGRLRILSNPMKTDP